MGSLRAGQGLQGTINQSNAQTINGSLRFNSASSLYLSRPFSSTGNQKTCTFSAWVKRSKLGTVQFLFEARDATGDSPFQFNADDTATIGFSDGTYALTTSQVFRDASAWYHIVIAFDTTQTTGSDRVKLYVNGIQITQLSGTYPPQDHVFAAWNKTGITHYISNYTFAGPRLFMDCMSSNIYFIDGQALGPWYFGYTDPLTNTWRPKKFRVEGTTINDGTTWSDYTTAQSDVSNIFDGSTSTFGTYTTSNEVVFTPLKPIKASSLKLYVNTGSGSPIDVSTNGTTFTGSYTLYNGAQYSNSYPITNAELTQLRIKTNAGGGGNIYQVIIDGEVLIDNTITNLSFGTNGFYLPLDDQDDYTTDKSGKGNNWTANGFTGTSSNPDVVPDSPSGVVGSTKPTSGITTTSSITKPTNYATLNPLNNGHATAGGMTLSNGNLSATNDSTQRHIAANMAFPFPLRGKFYFEMTPGTQVTTPVTSNIGFGDYNRGNTGATNSYQNFYTRAGAFYIQGSGFVVNDAAYAFGDGDTIGCAIDFDSNIVKWYRNGSLQQSLSFPAPTVAVWPHYVSVNSPLSANFGQRPFKHQPPAGYLTLCSANVRPSTVVTRPNQYVGVMTYTGLPGGAQQNKEKIKFTPDLVWVKNRSVAEDHKLYDTVRGQSGGNFYNIESNTTATSGTESGAITQMLPGGFYATGGGHVNSDGVPFVAWMWKAGGGNASGSSGNEFWKDDIQYASAAAAGLTAGTITPTGASVNTKSGFSIIRYTGGSNGASDSVPHGLGRTPGVIFHKNLGASANWNIKHSGFPSNYGAAFTTTEAQDVTTVYSGGGFADLTSDTTFGFLSGTSNANNVNEDGADYICYIWADVPGLQKFGKYTGNGNADGPFVELGFKPALIIIKNIDSSGTSRNWAFVDSTRSYANVSNHTLAANLNNPESGFGGGESVFGASNKIDLLSNGFKLRENAIWGNTSGETYIYMAWAAAPEHNLFGGQSLAR